jgi:hypothetical protein
VNEEFGEENHQFWLPDVEKLNEQPLEKADNTFIGKRTLAGQLKAYFRLLLMLHRAEKVILHGLFNPCDHPISTLPLAFEKVLLGYLRRRSLSVSETQTALQRQDQRKPQKICDQAYRPSGYLYPRRRRASPKMV